MVLTLKEGAWQMDPHSFSFWVESSCLPLKYGILRQEMHSKFKEFGWLLGNESIWKESIHSYDHI